MIARLIATLARTLQRLLTRRRRPRSIPDADLLAIAIAVGVHKPLTLISES